MRNIYRSLLETVFSRFVLQGVLPCISLKSLNIVFVFETVKAPAFYVTSKEERGLHEMDEYFIIKTKLLLDERRQSEQSKRLVMRCNLEG